MPAQPRDLLKPRAQRLMEVAHAAQQETGLADGQYVTYGCKLAPGGTNTQLAISDGEYFLAQSLIEFPTNAGITLTTAANWAGSVAPTNTGAGQSCYCLVEADVTQPTPVVTLTQGVIVSSGTPVLPTLTPTRIMLGYLAIPASFTFGTTALTAGGYSLSPTGICVTQSYDAGNINPAGTQGPTGSTGGF